MDPFTHCFKCHAALEDTEEWRVRKRKRARQCNACSNAEALKRRKDDPIQMLRHRWYNVCAHRWPNADPSLWSIEMVKHVYERWEQKSVLSGESNVAHLCISYYRKHAGAQPPTENELVLLSGREAQSLAKKKDREGAFPARVRELIEPVRGK
jgi:hypothetical protein